MKRYKKKIKPAPEPIKERKIIYDVDYEHMWCPKCGANGEGYLQVCNEETHYYSLNVLQEDGYYESGEEYDYECTDQEIVCTSCYTLGIDPITIYKFSIAVQEAVDPEEGDYLEVAERLANKQRITDVPF